MNKKTKELNYQNNESEKKIDFVNQDAYTDMICYLRGSDISEYDQETVRQDLLEMILSAQKRNENIRSVIGEDYKSFCNNIVSNLPPKTIQQKVIESFDIICWCLSILITIKIVLSEETATLLYNIVTRKPLYFNISFSVSNILSMGVILIVSVIIVKAITKNSFEVEKNQSYSKAKWAIIGTSLVVIFLLIAWFGIKELFTVNILVACATALILYIAHKILEHILG